MYMDNTKIFTKTEKELETDINYKSLDIGMEFDIEKCANNEK